MQYAKRVFVLLLGITMVAFGAAVLIVANLGSDAVTVLNQGVSETLKIEIGYGGLITNLVLFVVILIFNRKKINIGTVVTALLMGPLVNLFVLILPNSFSEKFIINLIFSSLSLIVCALGLALYIYSNTGLAPVEGFVDLISQKIKIKFGYTKIFVDIVFFIVGYLLGGVFHIASIMSVFIIGPLINVFLALLSLTNFIPKEEKDLPIIEENITE